VAGYVHPPTEQIMREALTLFHFYLGWL